MRLIRSQASVLRRSGRRSWRMKRMDSFRGRSILKSTSRRRAAPCCIGRPLAATARSLIIRSPQGTSWIDAMLFAGEQYTLVVSQWAFNTPGQTFENTITGLAAIIPGAVGVTGDLNGDGFVDGADLAALLAN